MCEVLPLRIVVKEKLRYSSYGVKRVCGNNFKKDLQKIFNKCEREIPRETIYKYIDKYDTLEDILSKRKLWHRDYRFFNDPSEIKYGKALILQVLERTIKSKIESRNYETLTRIFNNFDKNCAVYVCSYSREIDKLSLWRYYADNSSGFSIGFNSKHFSPNIGDVTPCDSRRIGSILYGEKAKKLIQDTIDCWANYLQKDSALYQREEHIVDVISCLYSYLPFMKDPSFTDEHEVRMYYMEGRICIDPKTQKPFYFDNKDKQKSPPSRTKKFVDEVNKATILTPHTFEKNEISAIYVGSSCNFENARNEIISLLKRESYDWESIKIRPSKLPFRW